MKAFTYCSLFVTCLSTTLLPAVLPPFYQSIREVEAILQDPSLPEQLQTAYSIDTIKHVEGGWLITAAEKTVMAKIIPLPPSKNQPRVGPLQFKIEW